MGACDACHLLLRNLLDGRSSYVPLNVGYADMNMSELTTPVPSYHSNRESAVDGHSVQDSYLAERDDRLLERDEILLERDEILLEREGRLLERVKGLNAREKGLNADWTRLDARKKELAEANSEVAEGLIRKLNDVARRESLCDGTCLGFCFIVV